MAESGVRGPTTWLHLVPPGPAVVPSPARVARVEAELCAIGLAVREGEGLEPGPAFARWLLTAEPIAPVPAPRPLWVPLPVAAGPAARPAGVVHVEAGILRVYPDPGPVGPEPRRYRAACPACRAAVDLYRLKFPGPDPLLGTCPACGAPVPVADLAWSPPLPAARFEITFGGLDRRATLAGHGVLRRLGAAAGTELREIHVTL